jgi:PleD family two-component response regulator
MDRDLEILDKIYNEPDNFLSRVYQELKRAQRYLNFVSYAIIDAQKLEVNGNGPGHNNNTELFDKLRIHIRNSIRQTDIVSGFNKGKLSVLLVETNKDGAGTVKNRLQESIKYFLHEAVESPLNWKVNIDTGSFPDNGNTPNSFYDFINKTLTE